MADVDPALLAALAGLLEQQDGEEQGEHEEAHEEEAVPQAEESLYERLSELEKLVN